MQNGGVTRARVTGSPTNERASQLRAHTAKEVTNPVVRRDYSSNGVDGRVVCVSRSFESKLTLLETVRYSTSLSLSSFFLSHSFCKLIFSTETRVNELFEVFDRPWREISFGSGILGGNYTGSSVQTRREN